MIDQKVGNLAYLGGKVESEVAVVCQRVLDHEGHIGRKAQLDSARKTTSLAEVDEVLERESERHGLRQLDINVQVFLVDVGVLAEGDGSRTDVASAAELDALFCALDVD